MGGGGGGFTYYSDNLGIQFFKMADTHYLERSCLSFTFAFCFPSNIFCYQTGLQHYVIAAAEPWGLPLNFTTMGQHFKRLGYATHIVGKVRHNAVNLV